MATLTEGRTTQVQKQIELMGIIRDNLGESINQLEEALSIVLVNEDEPSPTEENIKPQLVPHASLLREFNTEIQLFADRIIDILRRLEL